MRSGLCCCCGRLTSFVGTFILSAIYLFLLQLQSAAADFIEIEGLKFPVERISVQGRRSVKIALFGKTRMVSKERVNGFVVDANFKTPDRIAYFSINGLEKFVKKSLLDEKSRDSFEYAVSGYTALSRHPDITDRVLMDFTSEIEEINGAVRLFKWMVENNRQYFNPRVLARLILIIAENDYNWCRSRSGDIGIILGSEFENAAIARIGDLFARLETGTAVDLKKSIDGLLGANRRLRERIDWIFVRLQKSALLAEEGNLESLYPVIDEARRDHVLFEYLAPVLVKAVHEKARKLILAGQYEEALSVLTGIEISMRTPTTHAYVKKALEGLSPSDRSVLDNIKVELMLRALAEKDEEIRRDYIRSLDEQTAYYYKAGLFSRGEKCFERLLKLRLDPDKKNDLLRKLYVEEQARRGQRKLALRKLGEFKTDIDLMDKIKFVLKGVYIDYLTLSLLTTAILAVIVIAVFQINSWISSRRAGGTAKTQGFEEVKIEGQEIDGKKSFIARGRVRSSQQEEFEECLSVLGLSPGCSIQEIKAAYRTSVKEFHPDANPDADAEASKQFIRLTRAYNRIMEIGFTDSGSKS